MIIVKKHVDKNRILSCLLVLGFFLLTVVGALADKRVVQPSNPVTGIREDRSVLEEMKIWAEKTKYQKRFEELEVVLQEMISTESGDWSIYVKNLSTDHMLSINNKSLKAASLIKLFVMEYSYANLDTDDEWVNANMKLMISYSDNEAYNELVRLQSGSKSFVEGCYAINNWLKESEYENTNIYNSLEPSRTPLVRIDPASNQTSVEDCGRLLEAIYNGTCVSKEASAEMLELLSQQQIVYKIPAGVPEGVKSANKTGDADMRQHDVAIVYGPKTDYILCVMADNIYSKDRAIYKIQDISALVYRYMQ